ncbi:MAG: DUF4304 domain-containing protein [Lachnospiraceae bacterium]|nr:DUF4304 domain-containing protein [Lachnospiraceae bacterium]
MEIKEFYKKLWDDVYAILKPQGFRRKGSNIFLVQENGIVKLIELQKSRFNTADWNQFTMNVGLALFETPVEPEKLHYWCMHFRYHLGESLEDGWDHQFWYHVTFPKPYCWVENGIIHTPAFSMGTYLSMENIHTSVCGLVSKKVLPFWDSIQTHADYLTFLNENQNSPGLGMNMESVRMLARIYGKELLPFLERSLEGKWKSMKNWMSSLSEEQKVSQAISIEKWEKKKQELTELIEELKKG